MAIKKTELYSYLWQSCDELRGGMDAVIIALEALLEKIRSLKQDMMQVLLTGGIQLV